MLKMPLYDNKYVDMNNLTLKKMHEILYSKLIY